MPTAAALAQTTPGAAVAVPATQPTADDVQAAIDAKQYSSAVKMASKLLGLRGEAAANLSRFDLVMLKGIAQAGMRSNSTAIQTFKSAQKETQDPGQIALSKWTAELFRTAGSTTYVPRSFNSGPKRGPFDLLNPDSRKQAFAALLDDDLAVLDPKLKAAAVSQSLPQIWPVLQQVLDLDNLDVIANGSDDKTTQLSSALLEHSRNLLSNALKADWARVADIDSQANATVTSNTSAYINNQLVTQQVSRKNGLSENNRTELKNVIQVCQKIHDAAEAFMSLAKTDKDWSTILSDSDRVAGKASDVLSADYGTAGYSGASTSIGGLTPEQAAALQNGQYPTGQYPNSSINGGTNNVTQIQPTTPPKQSRPPTKTPPTKTPPTKTPPTQPSGTGD